MVGPAILMQEIEQVTLKIPFNFLGRERASMPVFSSVALNHEATRATKAGYCGL